MHTFVIQVWNKLSNYLWTVEFYYVGRKFVSFITCFQAALSEKKFYFEFRPLYRVYVLSWIEYIFYIQGTNALLAPLFRSLSGATSTA